MRPRMRAALAALALLLPGCRAEAAYDPVTGLFADGAPALSAAQLNAAIAALGVVPDTYRRDADGTDDAPSIQRAIDAICAGTLPTRTLRLRARHYAVRTPLLQTCQVIWQGQGWPEYPIGARADMPGTWLDVAATAFVGSASPIRIYGVAAEGSAMQDLALTQPVSLPADPATTWTPPDTAPLVFAEQVNGGIAFRRLYCYGVNRCLVSHFSGRTTFDDIRGQAWRVLLRVNKALDVVRIDKIHAFPYYSDDNRVVAWQQANATAVHLLRTDTVAGGTIFAFGVRDGLLADYGPTEADDALYPGTTTGAAIQDLSCDFAAHCLRVTAAAQGVTMRISNLRSFAQAWPIAPFAYLGGSDVVRVDGSAVLQIGTLDNFGTGSAAITLGNASVRSIVHIGSYYGRTSDLPAGWVLANLASGAAHQVSLAIPPAFGGALPSGYANRNGATDGTVSWPTPVAR